MFKSFTLFCCVECCCTVAFAEAGQTLIAPRPLDSAQQLSPARQSVDRRMSLRAAVASQYEPDSPAAKESTVERQLSHRERAELRKQLRLQRNN